MKISVSCRSLSSAAILAVFLLYAGAAVSDGGAAYLSRPEVRSFIEDLHAEHGLELGEAERILREARYQPAVVRLIGPDRAGQLPPVRSYPTYRARFLTDSRISAGTQYWETHDSYLRQAEAEFGVPAEVILGIMGVETAFGQNTGSFRVVDALVTIAFDGPRRQQYFREELKEFLLLARETGVDPLAIKGSYAGAMGLPQFMPSSYRRHAIDFDQDGLTDLATSAADAIGSVASYLNAYGWTAGEVPTVRLQLPIGGERDLVSGLERVHDVTWLQERGAKFLGLNPPQGTCSVVELPAPGKPSRYLAGFGNFEAITRYNRSTFYAATVLELAEAIRTARTRQVIETSEQRH